MKKPILRGICLALVLILCLNLAPQVQAADWLANWGTRGQLATELSGSAKGFYTGDNTYAEFSQYQGSADLSKVPDSTLYNVLQTFMDSKQTYITSYADTRPMYQYTDCQGGDTSSISSFYSGMAIGPEWDSGNTWNREHTWPNSKGEGSSENDIMMLRPTSKSENGSRGNKAYGESSGYYDPNMESGGKYDVRGDVARIVLYVYVRWGGSFNQSHLWGSGGVIESKEVLLKWMQVDPVDTWELGRNDSVQSITGTRNVFVDYPELAFLLLGEKVPATLVSPTSGNTEVPDQPVIPEPPVVQIPDSVTAPTAGTAYKWGMYQKNSNKMLYFAGTTANQSYYLATTEDFDAATEVTVEAVDGGYRLFFMDNGKKTYIDVYKNGTHINLRLTDAPTAVFTWNEEYHTFVTTVEGGEYYMGTYNNFATLSASAIKYIATSFPSQLYAVKTDAPVEPAPTDPAPTNPEPTEPTGTAPAEPKPTEPAQEEDGLAGLITIPVALGIALGLLVFVMKKRKQ